MSIISYRNEVDRNQKALSDLEEKMLALVKKEKQIMDENVKIQSQRTTLSKNITNQQTKLNKAKETLRKEEEKERKKIS